MKVRVDLEVTKLREQYVGDEETLEMETVARYISEVLDLHPSIHVRDIKVFVPQEDVSVDEGSTEESE